MPERHPSVGRNGYRIAVVPGDGIGPEVSAAAVQVLEQALGASFPIEFQDYDAGAECFRRTGTAFPEATEIACREAHAVLHGAAGLPDVLFPDGTEAGQDFSMKIRARLDLYANVRPIRLMEGAPRRLVGKGPDDIRFTIVRENTEGLYAARGGGNVIRGQIATDTLVMTREGVERIVRYAAELAQDGQGAPADGVKRVTIVDKANVLRSYAFFREIADGVLAEYPDVEVEHVIVDAMTVHMLERPEHFDVIVCENLFGDILSDLGAAIMGGMGLAPSGEIGRDHGYFQGSHGSAPTIAGKGLANPIACILSGAMMLDWLGKRHSDPALSQAAARIREATGTVLKDGRAVTPDIGGGGSTESCTAEICSVLG
ncbi:isocitrate/isopropylmalate dehydrogenase family protein [Thalassobaculum sp.]|uniref:isocitrate/isopropylmalate dehydrogenase family protein n=1 Tax=Thalassobaculum sp. TaxID=2022740 RepID=UPI0032EEB9F6